MANLEDDHARVRAELAVSQAKVSNLTNQLDAIQSENSALKSRLKDAQAMLGEFLLSANKQGHSGFNPLSGLWTTAESSSKRARSPSFEIMEVGPPRKKGKEKEADSMTRVQSDVGSSSNLAPSSIGSKNERETKEDTAKATENRAMCEAGPASTSSNLANASATSSIQAFEEKTVTVVDDDDIVPYPREASYSQISSAPSPSNLRPSRLRPSPEDRFKIKTDKKAFILTESTVNSYLQTAKTLEIVPPASDLEVPRTFIRLAYGGSDQQLLQFISKDMNPSGQVQRRLVFPTLDMNPSMPTHPGEPGLIFASRHEILSNPPWSLFCKRSRASPAVWHYLGDYECVLCGKMTAEQFKSQTLAVKNEWAGFVLKSKRTESYVAMRSRIALRIAGVIPLDDKEYEDNLINAEMVAVKAGNGRPVTEEEILAAFSNGDEGINIIRMTCLKYDRVFADDMQAKFLNYDALLAAQKRKKAEGQKSKARTSKMISQKSAGRTGKAQAQVEEGDEDVVPQERQPRRSSRKSTASMVIEDYSSEDFTSPTSDYEDN